MLHRHRQSFFDNRNITAIVLEVPNHLIDKGTVHAWATFSLNGPAPEMQVSRWGLPMITHLFPNDPGNQEVKEAFNKSVPSDDIALFSGYIADYTQKMATYAGSVMNPEEYGKQMVSRLWPTTSPYELGTAAAFDGAGFNGRPLGDDVMDVMLTLASNRPLQDGAAPDRNRIRTEFPYFGEPALSQREPRIPPEPQCLPCRGIELRRHIERVAALRRSLPPGGVVPEDYAFEGPNGTDRFSQLFGGKDTLVVYSMMFGPQRERACPMCTAMLTSWEGTARNLRERVALAVTARSPIVRLLDFKKERGWQNLQIYSDTKGDYTRAYVSADDGDVPGLSVFTRRDGTVRHFWSGEMSGDMADPGQDPRGAPDFDPLWTILDLTPGGRGATWYPKLEYASLTTIK